MKEWVVVVVVRVDLVELYAWTWQLALSQTLHGAGNSGIFSARKEGLG